jgi:hypothetical protein
MFMNLKLVTEERREILCCISWRYRVKNQQIQSQEKTNVYKQMQQSRKENLQKLGHYGKPFMVE